jgi:hypothetical protein
VGSGSPTVATTVENCAAPTSIWTVLACSFIQ